MFGWTKVENKYVKSMIASLKKKLKYECSGYFVDSNTVARYNRIVESAQIKLEYEKSVNMIKITLKELNKIEYKDETERINEKGTTVPAVSSYTVKKTELVIHTALIPLME